MIKLQEIPRYLVKLAAVLMLLYSDSHVSYTHIPQFSPFFFLTGENVVSIFINLLTNARSSFQQAYKVPDCIIPRKRRKIQEPIFLKSSFLKKSQEAGIRRREILVSGLNPVPYCAHLSRCRTATGRCRKQDRYLILHQVSLGKPTWIMVPAVLCAF